MSKSKSKLTGTSSIPVKLMPDLAPPPSMPLAVSTPMLQAILDRRLLTNEERFSLTGHTPIDILYIKKIYQLVTEVIDYIYFWNKETPTTIRS